DAGTCRVGARGGGARGIRARGLDGLFRKDETPRRVHAGLAQRVGTHRIDARHWCGGRRVLRTHGTWDRKRDGKYGERGEGPEDAHQSREGGYESAAHPVSPRLAEGRTSVRIENGREGKT